MPVPVCCRRVREQPPSWISVWSLPPGGVRHIGVLGRALFERCHKNPLRLARGDAILPYAVNLARRVSGNVRLVTTAARNNRNVFDHDKTVTATEALGYLLDRGGLLAANSAIHIKTGDGGWGSGAGGDWDRRAPARTPPHCPRATVIGE